MSLANALNGLKILLFGIEFSSLPNDKILDWFKLKAFADDKIKVLKKITFDFDRVQNMFSCGFLQRVVKSGDCVVKS